MRFGLTTLTLATSCSTTELIPHFVKKEGFEPSHLSILAPKARASTIPPLPHILCTPGRIRTLNHLIRSQVCYPVTLQRLILIPWWELNPWPLSYQDSILPSELQGNNFGWKTGIEPATLRTTIWCSTNWATITIWAVGGSRTHDANYLTGLEVQRHRPLGDYCIKRIL